MEENYYIITFKHKSGLLQKSQTVPFMGTVAEFVVSRMRLDGHVPVILYSQQLTKEEFDKVWNSYIDIRVFDLFR